MLNTAHFMGGIYPGLLKQLFGSDSGSGLWLVEIGHPHGHGPWSSLGLGAGAAGSRPRQKQPQAPSETLGHFALQAGHWTAHSPP